MTKHNIGEVLRQKRRELNYSVDDVCLKLHDYGITISAKTLYNYETSYRQPDADTLMALCEIYKIDDIMKTFGYDNKNSPETDESAPGESIETKLFKLFAKANRINDTGDISDADKEFVSSLISLARAYLKQRRN